MIVREAEVFDIPRYTAMACEFADFSLMAGIAPPDAAGFAQFMLSNMGAPNVAMWLAEEDGNLAGISAGLLYPVYFSPQTMIAQEVWWWVDPEFRGSPAQQMMRETLENWARENGAKAVVMIALENEQTPAVGRLYRRAGYRPLERSFIKEL